MHVRPTAEAKVHAFLVRPCAKCVSTPARGVAREGVRCLPALEIEAQRVIRTVLVTVIKKGRALLMSERFQRF
jgi:hypothetical protein